MTETILNIKDLDSGRSAGYEVVTNLQSIKLHIDNHQDCCESWGWFWCNDKPEDFIGAQLMAVSLTDEALNTKIIADHEADSRDEGGIMFVNLETDRGKLQFVAYNSHNGYYGHTATVECTQMNHEETL